MPTTILYYALGAAGRTMLRSAIWLHLVSLPDLDRRLISAAQRIVVCPPTRAEWSTGSSRGDRHRSGAFLVEWAEVGHPCRRGWGRGLRRSGSEALLAVVVQAADFGGRTAGNHRSRMTSWPGATITELVVPNSSNSPNGIVAARHGNLQVEDRSQGCGPQPAPIKMLTRRRPMIGGWESCTSSCISSRHPPCQFGRRLDCRRCRSRRR